MHSSPHIREVLSYDSAPSEQENDQLWQATSLEFMKAPSRTVSPRHKCPLVIWIYDNIYAAGESATSPGHHTVSDCAARSQTNMRLDEKEALRRRVN